ncbi:MAG: 30S ribosomal protein S4 [Parcubacteria group bacterium GW2011_GWC1_39_8]|nr:MAG: 30S ribosomal protein S4 [Parcubacteria group bacterium GW2011_GWC1_39_8]
MKIGPKYKIARRLGAPIFEKTQTPKYALSLARKERNSKGRGKPKSEYGRELIEKQKARFSYGLTEKQFRNYVDKSLHEQEPIQKLFTILESRLDNVLFRSGLSKTRAQARQTASHGHIMVNNKRVTIPSILLSEGDIVSLRAGSINSSLFSEASERLKTVMIPAWLKVDPVKKQVVVNGHPVYVPQEHVFDLGVVIEFYNR